MLKVGVASQDTASRATLSACLQQTGLVSTVVEWPVSRPSTSRPGKQESLPDVMLLHPVLAFRAASVRDQHRMVVATSQRDRSCVPSLAAVRRAKYQECVCSLRSIGVNSEGAEDRTTAARDHDLRIEAFSDIKEMLLPGGAVVEGHECSAADPRPRRVTQIGGGVVHHGGPQQVAWVAGVNGEMRLAKRAARQVEDDGRASGDADRLRNQRGRRHKKRERDQGRPYHCSDPHR